MIYASAMSPNMYASLGAAKHCLHVLHVYALIYCYVRADNVYNSKDGFRQEVVERLHVATIFSFVFVAIEIIIMVFGIWGFFPCSVNPSCNESFALYIVYVVACGYLIISYFVIAMISWGLASSIREYIYSKSRDRDDRDDRDEENPVSITSSGKSHRKKRHESSDDSE